MPGMSSGGESVGGGESWFALKKDEFYVILDSVLTEMTKCDERNDVSGCIELIKLLSDNGNTSDSVSDKLPTRDGCAETKLANRLNPIQSGNRNSGCIGQSEADTTGKRVNFNNPTPVNCRTTDNDTQLSVRNGVDCNRHLNKGNVLQSATCVARRPGYRDKARLQRPGVVFSKEVAFERRISLNGKTKNVVKANVFHPNGIAGSHGTQNIYLNTMRSDNQSAFNAKLFTTSRHQRQHVKNHELRLQHKSRHLCSGPQHDARVSSNRPSTEYRRHQGSHKQTYPGLCAKIKAHSFDRKHTTERSTGNTFVSNATEDQKSLLDTKTSHITDAPPFKLTPTADRKFLSTPPKAFNNKWTPVDKTVINNILDDILSSDDSHSSSQTRNNNDVDIGSDDVNKTANGFLLQNDVKVEDESDVTTDDVTNANPGNDGVIANVKLVDVRRFDVSQMSFKWKSQLLWRMRHDKVSQAPLASLCLT